MSSLGLSLCLFIVSGVAFPCFLEGAFSLTPLSFSPDVDDEYEDDEDPWEEGAEDILEKGEHARTKHTQC